MAKLVKYEPYLENFIRSVYPELTELAIITNTEKECLIDATRLITDLRRQNTALQAQLQEAEKLLDRAVRGGEVSPGTWVQIVCDVAGFLTTPTNPDVVVKGNLGNAGDEY